MSETPPLRPAERGMLMALVRAGLADTNYGHRAEGIADRILETGYRLPPDGYHITYVKDGAPEGRLTMTLLAEQLNVTVGTVATWVERYGPDSPRPFPRADNYDGVGPYWKSGRSYWSASRWPEIDEWVREHRATRQHAGPGSVDR